MGLRAGTWENAALPHTLWLLALPAPCLSSSFPFLLPSTFSHVLPRALNSPSATASLFIPFASQQQVLCSDQDVMRELTVLPRGCKILRAQTSFSLHLHSTAPLQGKSLAPAISPTQTEPERAPRKGPGIVTSTQQAAEAR